MVRLAILLVLLCLTIWEWRAGTRRFVYWLALVGLFAFFSLRYGQGTDYLTYLSIYSNVPPLQTLPNWGAFQYNYVEVGFFYLMSFFRMLGVHYVLFVAIMAGFSLFCVNRFIQKFCPLPIFALTFFFAVYSLTYMESGIRQMLAIAIVLGFVLVDWANGKRLRPLILIGVAMLMHTSAALLFILPVLLWNPRPMYIVEWKPRTSIILIALVLVGAAVINFVDLSRIIAIVPGAIGHKILSYYQANSSISLMALGNRTLFVAIALFLGYRAREEMLPREKLLFNLYIIGYGIYLLFMSFELIASRTNVYFRVVEFVLIPILFSRNRDLIKRTYVALPVMLALLSFLYVKDITATMGYAQYYSSNPLEYPYVTVFNTDQILESKFVNVKNVNAMNAYQTGGMTWDEYYQSLQRKPVVRSPIVPY